MSKPKNMTPEQEVAWKEKQRLRRSTAEYKAKAAVRARSWYERGDNKSILISKNNVLRSTAEGRAARNDGERSRYARSEEIRAKGAERQTAWRATDHGKALNRAKAARYADRKRLDKEFDRFLANMEADEC